MRPSLWMRRGRSWFDVCDACDCVAQHALPAAGDLCERLSRQLTGRVLRAYIFGSYGTVFCARQ